MNFLSLLPLKKKNHTAIHVKTSNVIVKEVEEIPSRIVGMHFLHSFKTGHIADVHLIRAAKKHSMLKEFCSK